MLQLELPTLATPLHVITSTNASSEAAPKGQHEKEKKYLT